MANLTATELFLFSPFPGDERTKLTGAEITVKDFYNHIYTKAWFERDSEENIDDKDSFQKLKEKKDEFETHLITESHSVPRPFYITGYCGCGKSIYLGNLIYTLQKSNFVIKLDFATIGTGLNQYVVLFGHNWINKFKPANTLTYFINILLGFLNGVLEASKLNRDRINKYLKFHEKLVEANYFEYEDIFEAINTYAKDGNAIVYSTTMFRVFQERLEKENKGEVISDLLCLVYLLSYAQFYHSSKRIYIAIDSLEHYLRGDSDKKIEIFNSEIAQISEILSDSLTNFAYIPLFQNKQQSIYDKIRIVICCRDTTKKMIPIDTEDALIYSVNISEWFRASDILQDRIKYYDSFLKNKFCLLGRDTIVKALQKIFDDEVLDRGLYDKLHEMYNYNYRRLIVYLVKALETNNIYHDYLFLIDKATDFRNQSSNDLAGVYTRGARQTVVASLLRDFSNIGFFDKLYATSKTNMGQLGLSCARRILNFLCRKVPMDLADEDENAYIPLYELLEGAFRKTNGDKITDETIKVISEVLVALNTSDAKENHWCQLVVIKFNDGPFEARDMGDMLIKIRDRGPVDFKNFSIKINNAGRFFLAHMSEFEYFAARYTNYSPLFCKSNLEKDGTKYKCIKLIEEVMRKTFDERHDESKIVQESCLDGILEDDRSFFSKDCGGGIWDNMYSEDYMERFYLFKNYKREYPHAERTLEKHISYLDDFRIFILSLTKEDFCLESDEEFLSVKKDLSQKILAVIEKYVKKLQEFYDIQDGKGHYYCGGKRIAEADSRHYDTSTYMTQIEEAKTNYLNMTHIRRNN